MNPFDEDVGSVDVPIWVALPTALEPELFYDGDRFLSHLTSSYTHFDVLTYSSSRAIDPPLRNIRRLIINLPLHPRSGLKPKEVRVVPNNHAKLFFCYSTDNALQAVYLGSQNLTYGSQINIMYRADYLHNQPLLKFFNDLWNLAKKLKKNTAR
jgi:hypothetical protein